MYKVDVENPCGCFTRNGFRQTQELQTKEAAEKEANRMLAEMNANFCKKHEFSLTERFGNFKIFIKPRR